MRPLGPHWAGRKWDGRARLVNIGHNTFGHPKQCGHSCHGMDMQIFGGPHRNYSAASNGVAIL